VQLHQCGHPFERIDRFRRNARRAPKTASKPSIDSFDDVPRCTSFPASDDRCSFFIVAACRLMRFLGNTHTTSCFESVTVDSD